MWNHPGWLESVHCVLVNNFNGWCKQVHIQPLAWHLKYKPYDSLTPLQQFSPFCSPVKEKEKQWRIKGLTMAQWINVNQNNRSVLERQYSVLWEKTDYIIPPLVGHMAGRQASRWNTGDFNFLNSYRLNYLDFYFD